MLQDGPSSQATFLPWASWSVASDSHAHLLRTCHVDVRALGSKEEKMERLCRQREVSGGGGGFAHHPQDQVGRVVLPWWCLGHVATLCLTWY